MTRGTHDVVGAARSFDPRLVGALECETWVTYYRRQWWPFLRAAVRVTRHAFALPWPRTLLAAWWVMRANQHWAPYPDNDPDKARRCMRRFYALVAAHHGESFCVTEAARLEVEWWRLHRERQHADDARPGDGVPAASRVPAEPAWDEEAPLAAERPLIEAIAHLYGHVYAVPVETVLHAAEERALAMRLSDRWVARGRRLDDPLVGRERAALVRSYAALLAAVHRPT